MILKGQDLQTDGETTILASNEFRIVEPFDKSLAGLSLRFPSNHPVEEGYDIALSASFSPQVVHLKAGRTEIEVEFQIFEAEIQVTEINTVLDFGSDYFALQTARRNQWFEPVNVEQANTNESSSGVGASPTSFRADLKSSNQDSAKTNSTQVRDLGFVHTSPKIVRLRFGDKRMLEGAIMDGYVGWSAEPVSISEPSGVRFDLVVRESWIKFLKVQAHTRSRLGNSINKILSTGEIGGAKKRDLFLELLKRLAIHGLPHKPGYREAILDSAGRYVIPSDGTMSVFGEEFGVPGSIQIREDFLKRLVECDAQEAPVVFKAITNALDASVGGDAKGIATNTNRSHAPHGTYFAAIDALNYLNSEPVSAVYETEALKKEIGDNTYNDLSILGFFLKSRKSRQTQFKKFGGSPDVALFRAVLDSNWFPVAEKILENDVRIDTTSLGSMISDHFRLHWSESSQKRNGQNIKKWVINLSTSLSSPDNDHPDYFYISSFKKRAQKKGAIPTITQEMATIFETEKLKGVPYSATSKRFGLAVGSYLNWKVREPELAQASEEEARRNLPDLFGDGVD